MFAWSEVLDGDRLNLIGKFKSKHARIEVQLAVERTLDVLGFAKAVLLAFKSDVRHRHTFLAQGIHHHLGLVRRDDFVFQSLKENYGTRQAVNKMNRRALNVEVAPLGIRSD